MFLSQFLFTITSESVNAIISPFASRTSVLLPLPGGTSLNVPSDWHFVSVSFADSFDDLQVSVRGAANINYFKPRRQVVTSDHT